MTLRICILGSGSSGNCTYIASDTTALLIDAGLSAREIARRLEATGLPLDRVAAICVSHEHSDHTAGIRVLHQRHGVALYANNGTLQGLGGDEELRGLPWKIFTTGAGFAVGDLAVEPFSVPHDAYEPVGFVVACGDVRVGVVTDIGIPTTLVRERLRACRAIVLEANHDERMLMEARRPWSNRSKV